MTKAVIIPTFLASYFFTFTVSAFHKRAARQLLIQGVIAVLAFAFGLTSGIMSLKRKHFAMTAFGTCIIIVAGFVNVLVFGVPRGFGYTSSIYPILVSLSFGLPILVPSILSIILVFLSRREFPQ